MSFDYKAKRFMRGAHLPPVERHHAWKEIFSPESQEDLLSETRVSDPLDVYRARYAETEGAQELARFQDLDLGIYLVDDLLVKTDRASMAHSLEARVPFLDPVVAELALALETKQKVRGFSKKRLLAAGRRTAVAAGDHPRSQAGLFDPGGGVVARRPRAVRARCPLAGDDRATGLPEPGRR